MKRIFVIMMVGLLGMWGATPVFAAPTVTTTVSASIPSTSADMVISVFRLVTPGQDPFTGVDVTAQGMQFGPLTHTLAGGVDAGAWFSDNYFAVMIFTNSFGNRYQITSTCAGIASGANTLPVGSFGLTPGYSSFDQLGGVAQGAQPSGSILGTAGSAIATSKIIYQSELAATNRIIRAFYSLPPLAAGGALPYAGYQSIPLTQAPGTYTGQLTISIVAF